MKKLAIASALLCGVTGCSTLIPASSTALELFPGGKDSMWAYDTEIDKVKGFQVVVLSNLSTTGDNGFKLYSAAMPGITNGNLVRVAKESIQIGNGDPALKFKLPLGEKDEPQFKEQNKDYKAKIVANETVNLTNGNKFTAWRIDFNDTTQGGKTVTKWWLAPGVGLVKYEGTDAKTVWELSSYTLR